MAIDTKKKKDDEKKPTISEAAAAPIGKPIMPNAGGMSMGMPIGRMVTPPPAPAMGSEPIDAPPAPVDAPDKLTSIGQPIQPSVRGASDSATSRLSALTAQGPPQYHGIKRIGDALLGATSIGTAIEQAGGFGSAGYDAQVSRAERGLKNENAIVSGQEDSTKAAADVASKEAETSGRIAGDELVDVTMPDGSKQQVMRKNLATPTTAVINAAGAQSRVDTQQLGENARNAANISARQKLQSSAPVSLDELAAQAIKENDQETLTKIQGYKEAIAKAGGPEPGAYVAVNDAAGNVLGWVNPKSKQWVPVGSIAGGAVGAAAGATGAGGAPAIPPKPTGQALSREEQANVVMRAGDTLIGEIESKRDKLGNLSGLIQSALLNTPWADPETQGLRAAIASFAALQPAMHGFRGTDALREFEKLIGGIPNNPDALIAGIRAMMQTASAFDPNSGAGGGAAPPAGRRVIKLQ